MVDIVDKALRMGEGRQLKKLENVAKATNALEDEIAALDDEELKGQTAKFKQRIENGESLDKLMPEAFATVREASKRTLGLRHFDVQLMGGAALHWGNIAEMKTGEGKTLVATLPAYLNALEGKGVHVVTVNDYLASYQAELMGRVYRFLGMSTGCIITDQKPPERRKQYNADITYGTNNEFGFDYLRDNMAWEKSDLVQRGHHFAIVDEVDSILIDEARTPLIISGPAEGDVTRWYRQFARLVTKLNRDEDYEVDEKKKVVGILDPGITKVEDYLGIDNLYEPSNTALIGYLNNAIKAKELFLRDRDYVVTGGEVLIVDEHTGRILPGRRYNEGLHQAIEAKEGVEVKAENQTFATITLQNYFRMYDKLSGMTGTAETEAAEFMGTYKLGVLPIPTNKPMIREDKDDLIFRTKKEKLAAIVRDVAQRHKKGQPVLLGTASVESSEVVSSLLDVANIPHQVLNAKQHDKEAAVVAVAGRKGAVTVATNMAGRGTDIMLGGNVEFLADAKLKSEGYSPDDTPEEYEKRWPGTLAEIKEQVKDEHEEVVELGGLYVLGTERHESRRIDNQLRGRSGRQGDPGESRFYLSLEDDLMRLFNTQLVARVMAKGMPEGEPIESKSVSKGVRTAQKAVESRNFEIRKNVLKYDDVMNKQRTVIYAERQAVLKGEDIHDDILRFIDDTVLSYIKGANNGSDKPKDWDWDGLFKALATVYPIAVEQEAAKDAVVKLKGDKAVKALEELIVSDAKDQYSDIEEKLGEDGLRQLERRVVLAVLDRKWREHLYEMDYLKDGIGLRGMGQRDPLVEYQREGYQMYNSMIEAIKEETIQLLFHIDIDRVATTEDTTAESDEDEAVDAAEAVMGLDDGEAAATDESAPAEPETDDEVEKTTIDEIADEQKDEPGIVGMQPISHAEGKVPANKRPKSEELHSPWADGRTFPGTGKNAQCPCGSGRKYKMCHGQNEK
ncbi:preprotein translocase subunit SecA [uncultured Bifidobacterium sp.]|uniref:preprotein translocase subunit SecA n=1 Tax=uncultured Bifidobacterium sp. TaxID=165187 RepID=UPI00262D1930|nr:preprotein translocase subunit SecA [uncultured Bifidobacterium sp.]